MRKGAVVIGLILLVLISSGCISLLEPSYKIRCSTGEKVSDPSLCPKGTTAPPTTTTAPTTTATLSNRLPPAGTPGPTTTTPPTTTPAPNYRILAEKDISFATVVRIQVQTIASLDFTQDEILAISNDIVDKITSRKKVNAIAIQFWESEEDRQAGFSIFAGVNWAPYGDWLKAEDVKAGDYSNHELQIYSWNPGGYKEQREY